MQSVHVIYWCSYHPALRSCCYLPALAPTLFPNRHSPGLRDHSQTRSRPFLIAHPSFPRRQRARQSPMIFLNTSCTPAQSIQSLSRFQDRCRSPKSRRQARAVAKLAPCAREQPSSALHSNTTLVCQTYPHRPGISHNRSRTDAEGHRFGHMEPGASFGAIALLWCNTYTIRAKHLTRQLDTSHWDWIIALRNRMAWRRRRLPVVFNNIDACSSKKPAGGSDIVAAIQAGRTCQQSFDLAGKAQMHVKNLLGRISIGHRTVSQHRRLMRLMDHTGQWSYLRVRALVEQNGHEATKSNKTVAPQDHFALRPCRSPLNSRAVQLSSKQKRLAPILSQQRQQHAEYETSSQLAGEAGEMSLELGIARVWLARVRLQVLTAPDPRMEDHLAWAGACVCASRWPPHAPRHSSSAYHTIHRPGRQTPSEHRLLRSESLLRGGSSVSARQSSSGCHL